MVNEGETHLLRIVSIDPERQRIGLSLRAVNANEQIEWMATREADAAATAEAGEVEDETAEDGEAFEETAVTDEFSDDADYDYTDDVDETAEDADFDEEDES